MRNLTGIGQRNPPRITDAQRPGDGHVRQEPWRPGRIEAEVHAAGTAEIGGAAAFRRLCGAFLPTGCSGLDRRTQARDEGGTEHEEQCQALHRGPVYSRKREDRSLDAVALLRKALERLVKARGPESCK